MLVLLLMQRGSHPAPPTAGVSGTSGSARGRPRRLSDLLPRITHPFGYGKQSNDLITERPCKSTSTCDRTKT